jgi:hypothetical protein
MWLQGILTAYMWLIVAVPLGHWNIHGGSYPLPGLLKGEWPDAGNMVMLAFVTLPAVVFWVAYRRRSFWLASSALVLDAVWFCLQIESWWIPYAFGPTHAWQRTYAWWPTTRILPSFQNHLAPDGMHTVIGVLLAAVLWTGVAALVALRRSQSR